MNIINKKILAVGSVLVCYSFFFLLCTSAHAQGNIKVGGVEIHPSIGLQMKWDDNIYNTSEDDPSNDIIEDTIMIITPGLSLNLGTDYKLSICYSADINSYSEYDEEDYTSHTSNAKMAFNFPSGLTLNLNDTYVQTKDTRPEIDANRASHWTNNIWFTTGFRFPADNLSLEVKVSEFMLEYDQEANEGANRKDDSIGMTMYYRFLPKTSMFTGFNHTITDYYDSSDDATDKDSKAISLNGGLKWDATGKITGTFQVGYTKKSFDNSGGDASNDEYTDKGIVSMATNLGYHISDTTTMNLGINRSIEETEYGGSSEYSKSAYYTNTRYTLGLALKFLNRINLDISSGLGNDKYNKRDDSKKRREDDVITFSGGLSYHIREWLHTSLKYTYTSKDSNDDDKDQVNNKVMLGISATL
ncbi:MAG: outer membrane beta-barrel protein [bacterium]